MDHHTVAAVGIVASCLDVLGTLYLAYDLLGGQHGPLRLLTSDVTTSLLDHPNFATDTSTPPNYRASTLARFVSFHPV